MFASIRLQNFRSYADFAVELINGVNIIIGPNASGKTNLLESINMLCIGTSFRNSDTDLIQHGTDWSRIDGIFTSGKTRSLKLDNTQNKFNKSYLINDQKKIRLKHEDLLPVVLFEPEDMRLLTGSPELRRSYIDKILVLTDPTYFKTLKEYKRTLLQRNRLLKAMRDQNSNQLFVWDLQLSQLGEIIVKKRNDLINNLNSDVSEYYTNCANKPSHVNLIYNSKFNIDSYATEMLNHLKNNTSLDIIRGYTATGPHREDIEVTLNNNLASLCASRGETRTLVLSLKLLELNILRKNTNKNPILLLDDVFSELDGSRRQALTQTIGNFQTIITTTDADLIQKHYSDKAKLVLLT